MADQVIECNINDLSHGHLINLRMAWTNGPGPYGYMIAADELEPLMTRGPVEWRRVMATSPYMHGDTESFATLAMAPLSFNVNISGDPNDAGTHEFLYDLLYDLIYAVQSAEWEMEIVAGGMIYRWLCLRANYSWNWDRLAARGTIMRVAINTLSHPIPIAGPL